MTNEPPDTQPPSGEPPEAAPTPEAAPVPEATPPPGATPPRAPRRLTRSVDDRVIGGVAGGLANYLDVDPVLVRLAWVALVIFGGTGILLYLIAWIIIPEEPATDVARREAGEQSPSAHASAGTSGALILAIILIAFGSIALLRSIDINVPSWQIVLSAALALIGLGLIAQARRGVNGGLIAIGVLISIVLAGSGGIRIGVHVNTDHAFSDDLEAPRTAASLQDDYSTAFGSLTIDLSDLDVSTLPPGTTRIEANAAFGSIEIRVGDLPIRVDASSVFGSGEDYESPDYATAERRILIDASTAFGSSEVRR